MSNPESGHASVFAALGDTTRLALIGRLNDGKPLSIVQLTNGLQLSRQGVTKHLRVLERAGLVRCSRVGRESKFTFVAQPVHEVRHYLDSVSKQWDDALNRLKDFVES